MKKAILTVAVSSMLAIAAWAQNQPYITRVYDFQPAPGQFVNTMPQYKAGEPRDSVVARASKALCGYWDIDDGDTLGMVYKPGMVSLGSYGGYVVFGFDHPVVNVAGDYDFQVFGNAFQGSSTALQGGSSEPGIVMVSCDVNHNGVPDDPWYELAGSDYYNAKTQHGYSITYYRPASEQGTYDGSVWHSYIKWTSNDVNPDSTSGYVEKNTFHAQSYWPMWVAGDTLSFSGTKLAGNAIDQSGQGSMWVQLFKDWGYVDNRPDYDPYSGNAYAEGQNRGFKIDWAVDAGGHPVVLDYIDYVKVYCGTLQSCGWIGETSTEVAGAVDFHPQAVAHPLEGDANADGRVDVSDVTTVINLILGQAVDGYNPVQADVNGDAKLDVSDITSVNNIILLH